jgi:hypothetical protein
VDGLDHGLVFLALPLAGFLAALLVCEMVQWLVGSGWRNRQVPKPRGENALALIDTKPRQAPAAEPAWQRALQQFLTPPQTPRLG